MKTVDEIRSRYLAFYAARGHAVIPSAPLVPENDPTTLFTSSGMQPLVPYLMGQPHPMGVRLTDSQKSLRAEDVEEVGDNRHTTFFEMLGNWSLGDYFKAEQLPWVFEFLTKEVGLDPSRLYVTCFIGDETTGVPRDTQAAEIWEKLFADAGVDARIVEIGSEARGGEVGMQGGRIFYYDASKNWWSRSGKPEKMPVGEIGGPDSEIFYDFGHAHNVAFGAQCHPNCDCGRFMEIGNSVFIQYVKEADGSFGLLSQSNVDFGGGLERIAAAARGDADVFRIDVFAPVIAAMESASGAIYGQEVATTAAMRVIADHLRSAVFLIGDGVLPSNKEQGYVLRRLIRRATLYGDRLGIAEGALAGFAAQIVAAYEATYTEIATHHALIVETVGGEEAKFRTALAKGLREFERIAAAAKGGSGISGHDAFVLFTTYGFPYEVTEELAAEKGLTVDRAAYDAEFAGHQDQSRSGSAQKFKGGLADHSAKVTALHTCTHLMLAGLRRELGDHVHQAGSNITEERTRFDFTHPEKVPRDVLDRVEAYVNEAIAAGATVVTVQIPKDEARATGVEGSFWEKYPDIVTVYRVAAPDGTVYSQELCGGPHVATTADIAAFGQFHITKEEASSAGVRRVKGVLTAA